MCRGVLDAYFLQHVHGNEGCMCVCVFTSDIINYLQSTLKALNFAFQERFPAFLQLLHLSSLSSRGHQHTDNSPFHCYNAVPCEYNMYVHTVPAHTFFAHLSPSADDRCLLFSILRMDMFLWAFSHI